ncbi:chromosome partition protein Smc [mine drainage metagenome]|uniref:Chromosome partition protein Smc n=1 Tax=mine drainage metagenome TaxID=410659 RepID=A0A1J5QGQ6_9ZZZZ
MRLTHLKLAGFKSFVDPTTLHIHGQRVGVVGPNGCGKSNVMESIRWVLGESSAREMRGDSMQDVIFNGSGNRKPVSRASVELLFDNSLGGAAGEWSHYAEISVKRVLARDSGSSYYINNTQVRRRDVADLFLGTGLGGRAYAIIGQNTITRIVEAKPEELRVFLEEAAGISKYKERRRETELRLRDTRENLTRVEDIRRELDKQITRLASQAQVAEQYHQLQQSLGIAQGQFWLLKKRDAAQVWEKSRRQVERLANELEAQLAQVRKTESDLEQLRLQHYAGGEAVQTAQGRYYEANAQVSTLGQNLRHAQENHERLAAQLAQMITEQEQSAGQKHEHIRQLAQQQAMHAQALMEMSRAQQALDLARATLPGKEQAQRDAQAAFGQIQSAMHQAEQQIQLEHTHLEHARKSLEDINQRQLRLAEDEKKLLLPDVALISAKEAESQRQQAALAALEAELVQLNSAEQAQSEQLKVQQQAVQRHARHITQVEAQFAALQKLQHALGHEGRLDAWLERQGIDGKERLWQCIKVEAGFETALEALLGNRLNALMATNRTSSERPPAAVVLCQEGAGVEGAPIHAAGWRSLASLVEMKNPRVGGVLADWLAGVWLLPEGADSVAAREQLAANESLVSREGDIFTRHSVALYAPQSGLHGVLERQRELAQIESELPVLKHEQQQREALLVDAARQLHGLRRQVSEQQHLQRQQTAAQHALRMELQRLQQQSQHALERQQHLSAEQARLAQQQTAAQEQLREREKKILALQESTASQRQQREEAGQLRQQTENALRQARDGLLEAERSTQQKIFEEKILLNGINELNSKIKALDDMSGVLETRLVEIRAQLDLTLNPALKSELEHALEFQRQAEQALADARNVQAGVEQTLHDMERSRLQAEQQLHPLRDKLEQSRLHEQQARLHFEYCTEQLEAAGFAEGVLESDLDKAEKALDVELRVQALEVQIAELGAVNLAAIAELLTERERKTYLDSQSLDLEQAINTLEEAIHRIDKETRSRLQHTYDEANRHFSELFQTLFGGGQAQLQLLGDEILDTGVQVFAQPPGKKNSTIHLLSGGEKALTAMALVFALFRLNPAPFCLMDEVDAPLDDSNTERFCALVRKMSERTQFMFVSHNKITMEMAQQLIGVTMQESGVSRIVEVDMEAALRMQTDIAA